MGGEAGAGAGGKLRGEAEGGGPGGLSAPARPEGPERAGPGPDPPARQPGLGLGTVGRAAQERGAATRALGAARGAAVKAGFCRRGLRIWAQNQVFSVCSGAFAKNANSCPLCLLETSVVLHPGKEEYF